MKPTDRAARKAREAEKNSSPQAKRTPSVVGMESVKALCGHEVPFQVFADKQDKFREQRRLKAPKSKCKECRLKDHEDHVAEQKRLAAKGFGHQLVAETDPDERRLAFRPPEEDAGPRDPRIAVVHPRRRAGGA